MSAQEDYDTFSAMAERLQLDEEEAENFIGSAMKRLGYKARQMWEDDDSGGGNSGGDFFSAKRRERRSATPPRRSSGGNWQYGRGA